MKRALLFFLLGGLLITCKKDNSSKLHGTALSRIFQDDILIYEFLYSSDNRLMKQNGYNEVSGQLAYAVGFEYDADGNTVLENYYTQTNKLSGQVIYILAPGGKINYHEYKPLSGADSGNITVRVRYTYDAAGRIITQAWVDIVTDEIYTTREISYYDNNNIRSSEIYYYYNGRELQWKTEYSPEGNPIPEDLMKFKGYPINFLFSELVAGQQHFYSYDSGNLDTETNDIASDTQYDNKGFLLQQKITRKHLLPVGPSEARQMRYEYIKL